MIRDLLTSLKMQGSLEALPNLERIEERDLFAEGLLQAELKLKEQRALLRRLKKAKFPTEKEWCDLDYSLNPSIKFSKVQELGNGKFIEQHTNLCLLGQQGIGKTHSLIALGRQLCRAGFNVKFYSASQLVNALEEAKKNHRLEKLMYELQKPHLLIIDELGFVPLSENGARLLFDVFATRYERGSIAISSNLSFDKWTQVFGTVELTVALVDRFTHKCLIFNYEGTSVRFLEAKKRNAIQEGITEQDRAS